MSVLEKSNTNNCIQCASPVIEQAFFCFNCGIQVRCKNCQEILTADAQHCIACGTPVLGTHEKKQVNTFKLREGKEERVYEIQFTNEVGKEIKEVIADLLKGKSLTADTSTYNLYTSKLTQPIQIVNSAQQLAETKSNLGNKSEEQQQSIYQANEPTNSYPHLNDLEIKLNCKENEWLLLFAFYYSDFGVNTFTKDVVWQVYKDRRKTETRFKNLGTNWKSLFKKHIATVKENEFRFTPVGLQKVKSLLHEDAIDKKSNSSVRKLKNFKNSRANSVRTIPVSRKVIASSIVPNEFDVYQDNYKESLESFFKRKNPGSGNPNRIVTIAYYITNINHQEYFTEGNIDYAYRILNLGGKPAHLKQVIINLKNERIWFQKILDQSIPGWKLTRQAEIYVEEKLPIRV